MQARFLTPLNVEKIRAGWWRLTAPLAYYSEMLGQVIVAPEGFVTDFASVPRLPLAYLLFGDRAHEPAVIHDRLYRWGDMPRITADRIFNEAMRANGKWLAARWPMTAAVMGFGWIAYKNLPGCLDYRDCPKAPKCSYCVKYFKHWERTIMTLEEWKCVISQP